MSLTQLSLAAPPARNFSLHPACTHRLRPASSSSAATPHLQNEDTAQKHLCFTPTSLFLPSRLPPAAPQAPPQGLLSATSLPELYALSELRACSDFCSCTPQNCRTAGAGGVFRGWDGKGLPQAMQRHEDRAESTRSTFFIISPTENDVSAILLHASYSAKTGCSPRGPSGCVRTVTGQLLGMPALNVPLGKPARMSCTENKG